MAEEPPDLIQKVPAEWRRRWGVSLVDQPKGMKEAEPRGEEFGQTSNSGLLSGQADDAASLSPKRLDLRAEERALICLPML
jgi:hypothetical protein